MKKHITTILFSTTLLFAAHTPTQAATFTDVPTTHWAYEAIDDISTRGLINGYPDGTYRLNQPVTRAQAAKIVALAINAKPSTAFKPRFQDVSPAHGSYDHIRALTESGIFSNEDKFQPNKPLTRAEMSKMLALGYKITIDDNDQIKFSDVTKQNHYHGYITTLAELGITTTPAGGAFKPNDNVSRAQMAAFLHRTMEFDNARTNRTIVYDKAAHMYIKNTTTVNNTDDKALKTITLVNEQRTQLSVTALTHDKELSKVAQAKAQDMANNNYFAHSSPTYGSTSQLLDTFNYKWTAYGENIAKGQLTPEEVVKDWMDSPTHRANIINNKFTHIGTGSATDATGTIYWVHEFSRK
ncbi:S-layer homology domain-containing protein [Sporosarcina sp. YIM B06819]|uniref:CAP and S-layer homology domain-containing protein n=1 Tax=Sporosarcina sp. YIM B06819 TaxID=3081769 RepID=UPI00298D2FDF|nr:S-layer homology domain-containing protein [Sporosarcina sp. YIM B06819]